MINYLAQIECQLTKYDTAIADAVGDRDFCKAQILISSKALLLQKVEQRRN